MRPDRLGFGIFLAPFHPLHEDPTAALDRDMQLVEHLDQLGYDEAWIGEHFTAAWEPCPAPDLLIARALLRTRQTRHGPLVLAASLPGAAWTRVSSRLVHALVRDDSGFDAHR